MAKKDPKVAASLSLLLSGLGQIYNGQIKKGIILICVSFFAVISAIIGGVFLIFMDRRSSLGIIMLVIGAGIIFIVGIYNIMDAYNYAKSCSESDKVK